MLRKKETFTVITPIPGFIPRQLAIDILHSHSEVITLNPLVIEHYPISAPRHAATDEFYSTWYEIVERIQYLPGIGKVGSGKLTFNGCFHDMPYGLQTHMYIPFNIEMRVRYRVAGNQPGIEPPEMREIGLENLGAPKDGLYLREDIELKCNIAMTSYIKSQTKAASKEMVSRIIKKAELLDAGVLQGMIENGKLRTVNPLDKSKPPVHGAGMMLPHRTPSMYTAPQSPTYPAYASARTGSSHGYPSPNPQWQALGAPPPMAAKDGVFTSELPGDMTMPPQHSPGYQPGQHSPGLAPSPDYRDSAQSYDPRWSQPPHSPGYGDPNRLSVASTTSSNANHSAHGPSFAAELPAHHETSEEHTMNSRR